MVCMCGWWHEEGCSQAGGAASPAPHTAARALRAQTLADLTTAMKGEAYAHAAYGLFAAEADRQGLSVVGKLFRSTARTELNEHPHEAAALAGTVGSNAADLRRAISGATYAHQVMQVRIRRRARNSPGTEIRPGRFAQPGFARPLPLRIPPVQGCRGRPEPTRGYGRSRGAAAAAAGSVDRSGVGADRVHADAHAGVVVLPT